jgi:4-amino-4-deoxy-L-arabinose transferase-like glycosyltransferase
MSLFFETNSARSPAARRPAQGTLLADRPVALSLTRARALAARLPRPELLTLLALAGILDLWALGRNGWANSYYSAAARSMSSSWHNFLFASMDPSGVMTVDKPPLAVWVQALSVRAFGYHPLSVLIPQALMGVASVALVYDLVRRRFGRLGGFVAGLALATTPIAVAISRHNNPDALLVLCCVAALWCAVRGLEVGRTRWLVLAGVFVGLGFETKMGVALTVVPGIFVAWLWIDPPGRGRLRALGQLLGGGAAMVAVGGAWPMLVGLTPAADRPWVSGTSDNSVLSLILDYNGLNRVGGQAGVPTGVGGNMSGGSPGPLRLLSSALGGQAGWLLGFALVTLLGMVAASRLRRSDARSGWLIAVGGAFFVTAALFSFAGGIFHPYYVALLAPFMAALAGAGFAELVRGGPGARIVGSLAVAAGVVVELVILGRYPGQLAWLAPLLIAVGVLAGPALGAFGARRPRLLAAGATMGALLIAPAVWAVDTLGYATSGTFPSGGPESVQTGRGGRPAFGGARGRLGGQFGDDRSIAAVLSYVTGRGGGTIAVSSQSSAAAAIIDRNANVAGIGGFSGRESDVSVAWLAQQVHSGRIRWVLVEGGAGRRGVLGDTRVGAKAAMSAVASACRSVPLAVAGSSTRSGSASSTLYDCEGRAAALAAAGRSGR